MIRKAYCSPDYKTYEGIMNQTAQNRANSFSNVAVSQFNLNKTTNYVSGSELLQYRLGQRNEKLQLARKGPSSHTENTSVPF